jgi:hypothetical protein
MLLKQSLTIKWRITDDARYKQRLDEAFSFSSSSDCSNDCRRNSMSDFNTDLNDCIMQIEQLEAEVKELEALEREAHEKIMDRFDAVDQRQTGAIIMGVGAAFLFIGLIGGGLV